MNTFNYPSSVTTQLRFALMQFAETICPNPTHMLTLNFHDNYLMDTAVGRIRTWYHFIMRRLFGRNWSSASAERKIEFILFPEHSIAGHIHYHGPAFIPEHRLDYFKRIAYPRWSRIVPTGSLHHQPITPTDHDRFQVLQYSTKGNLAADLLHSSMLRN